MQRLNPIDAIAPAFTRTHQVVSNPFKLGRTWKLCASSYIGFMGSMFIPVPIFFAAVPWRTVATSRGATIALACAALVFTLIFLLCFYLGVRMELVTFEKVVTRAKFIAPMWRRYSRTVWPWIGLKAAIGTAISILMAPLMIASGRHLFASMAAMPRTTPGQPPDPVAMQAFMAQIFGFYLSFFAIFIISKIISTLLNDFVLPFYSLEQLPLFTALSRGIDVIVADPVQIILYLFMKYLLAIVGFMMQYFASLVVMIPFLILVFIGAFFGALAHPAKGSPAYLLLIAAGILLYFVFFAVTFWWQIGTFGYLLTLLEAYSIYFLGGRYPMLGDILEPPAPPAYTFTPPPAPPSTDEDDGPTLPMDPALA